nr:DUF397 domain-containing protein [Pilimelia anulata]
MSRRTGWHKSTLSSGGDNCVEVDHRHDGSVAVRHSKNPTGPQLVFTPQEWDAFIGGAKLNEFDR